MNVFGAIVMAARYADLLNKVVTGLRELNQPGHTVVVKGIRADRKIYDIEITMREQ